MKNKLNKVHTVTLSNIQFFNLKFVKLNFQTKTKIILD